MPDEPNIEAVQHDDVDDEAGEVSEVASLDESVADVPISDDQGVAGNPDDESGEADVDEAGPNARAAQHES